ncbi:hypothetical protein V1264_008391 [Littorina saxatilis]|uniref:VWFA domain-containing protein n=2 Tax=Littorina saxatilis TaxID=31220 RepID=A0AAN9ATA1_9CAEN
MIADVVSNSDVGSNDVMFGVDTFDAVFRQQITLGEKASKSSLMSAVQNIGYHSGGMTNTALGLFGMQTVSFSPEAGGRSRAAKVGVVVTDGGSNDKNATIAAAKAARAAGIRMVAVGVGSPSYTELYSIATSSSYVYTGTSYSTKARLRTLIASIKNDC